MGRETVDAEHPVWLYNSGIPSAEGHAGPRVFKSSRACVQFVSQPYL